VSLTAEQRSGRPPRRIRLSALFVAIVLVTAGIGYVYLRSARHLVAIYVAARDLPVYYQITQSDVESVSVPAGQIPTRAVLDRADLVDHYTLRAVPQGGAFNKQLLGPRLLPGVLDRVVLVGLESSAQTTLGGELANGDRVDILLSATGASESQRPVTMNGVLVLAVQHGAVIVAVSAADERLLACRLGTSQLAVVRTGAYSEP
jgi:Flp pilus assembly protein CpaB